MTVVALWPGKSRFAFTPLLGTTVWKRTLLAARALEPRRVLWIGKSAPDGVDTVTTRELAAMRDTIICIPAELPCLQASALKRLLKASAKGPAALFASGGGLPVVLAAETRAMKHVRAQTLHELAKLLRPAPVFPASDDELLRVENAQAWSQAHTVLRRRKVESLVRRGVLIPDPSSVYVDPEISVGAGTVLSPWVVIEGDSRIAKGCVIGSFSHLIDATIGSGTKILDHCFIRESRIGKNASIGPFAHLRPASDVGDRARIGNFVELKNSRIAAGAKAPHLSYVGDATVGRGANLGAGTITCNYDGRVKSRTVIGDGAFVGSDVQLVAPVRIGKGAFVAAGSCIVKDVPAYALALARSRQVNKKGWARPKKTERRER